VDPAEIVVSKVQRDSRAQVFPLRVTPAMEAGLTDLVIEPNGV
jgi:hypothetical protein